MLGLAPAYYCSYNNSYSQSVISGGWNRCSIKLEVLSCSFLLAHYAEKVPLFEAVLYNKSTCLSQVELVWFGKDEKFVFSV